MGNSKKKPGYKRILSIIISCMLALNFMELGVFAVDSQLITSEGIPEELTVVKGQSVKLSGIISSDSAIYNLIIRVDGYFGGIDGQGIIYRTTPNSKKFDLSSITIDSKYMDRNNTEAFPRSGMYNLEILVESKDGGLLTSPVRINVLNGQITTEGIPQELTVVKGQSVKLSGSISCDSAVIDNLIIRVDGYFGGIDGQGIIYRSTPYSNIFDLSSITIDSKYMDINNMEAFPYSGTYDMEIQMESEEGGFLTTPVRISVLDAQITTEGIPQELTVVKGQSVKLSGIISSDSAIDNLIIRVDGYFGGIDGQGIIHRSTPNSKKFDLSSITIDSEYMDMNNIEAFPRSGTYNMEILVESEERGFLKSPFRINVLNGQITTEGIPQELTVVKGQSVKLSGDISCDSAAIDNLIIRVNGYFGGMDRQGIIFRSTPYSNKFDLSSITIDSKYMDMNNAEAFPYSGTYNLEILVESEGEGSLMIPVRINVLDGHITSEGIPQELTVAKGQSIRLAGSISCDSAINNLAIRVNGYFGGIDGWGIIYRITPNSNKFDLGSITIDSTYMDMDKIEAFPYSGMYNLEIMVESEEEGSLMIPVRINVLDSQITTEGIPQELTVVKGQGVKLSGSISSDSAIDNLIIRVNGYFGGIDRQGIIYRSTPYSNKFDLSSITIDSTYMDMNKIEAFPYSGTYNLEILVESEEKGFLMIPVRINVLDSQIISEVIPQELTVVKGHGVKLGGSISSDSVIDNLLIRVNGYSGGIDGQGIIYRSTPYSNKFDLSSITIDSTYMDMNKIEAFPSFGTYNLEILAESEGRLVLMVPVRINVLDSQITSEGISQELTVVKGQSVKLSGSISSDSVIDDLIIRMDGYSGGIDGQGIIYRSTPHSNKFDLGGIIIDSKYMDRNNKEAFPYSGTYNLEILAELEGRRVLISPVRINVLDGQITTEGIPEELTVVKGQSVKLAGSISSDSAAIDNLMIIVDGYGGGIDGQGIIYRSTPHSNKFDLGSIIIDSKYMDRSNKEAFPYSRTYNLEILVESEGRPVLMSPVRINVLDSKITSEGIPEELTVVKGQSVKLAGSISSDSAAIDNLMISVDGYAGGIDGQGIIYRSTPYSNKFDLGSITIDSKYMDRGNREAFTHSGTYYLKILVESEGRPVFTSPFRINVLDGQITSEGIPEELTVVKGQSVKLGGSISSDSVIDNLIISVDGYFGGIDRQGIIYRSTPYSNKFDLGSITIDSKYMDRSNEEAFPRSGIYNLKILVESEGRLVYMSPVRINVLDSKITSEGIPEELTVVKGQNIKLGGSISCDSDAIDSLTIRVNGYSGGFDYQGIIYRSTPYSNKFDLSTIIIDSKYMDRGNREAFPHSGSYYMEILVESEGEGSLMIPVRINVLDSKITSEGIPEELTVVKGQSVKLTGSISSDSAAIDSLIIRVDGYSGGIDGQGIIYRSTPYSNKFDLSSITIDSKYMDRGNKEAFSHSGTYNLKILVETEGEGCFMIPVKINVLNVPVSGITLQESLALKVGSKSQLIPQIVPQDATNKNVVWKTSDETVATVDLDGNVTAINEGEAIITVTTEDGSYSAYCKVAVTTPPEYDFNHDGAINLIDIMIVARGFNSAKGDARYSDAYDLNKDGAINMRDILILARRFNTLV